MRQIKINLYEKVLIALLFGIYVFKLTVWYFIDLGFQSIQLPSTSSIFFDNVYIQLLFKSIVYFLIYLVISSYGFLEFSLREWIKTILLFILSYCSLLIMYSLAKNNYYFQASLFNEPKIIGSGILYASEVALKFLIPFFFYLLIKKAFLFYLEKEEKVNLYQSILLNTLSITFFGYILLFYLLSVNKVYSQSDGAAILMVFFIPPTVVSIFINVFKVYPSGNKELNINKHIKTLIAPASFTFIPALIYYLLVHRLEIKYLIAHFFFQLLFSFPISLIFYSHLKSRFGEILFLKDKLITITADLQHLRSQINPHFLFNTLNMIYGSALKEKAIKTADSVQRLGDMMRFMLYENNNDFIPLGLELSYIENYIDLQRNRLDIVNVSNIKISLPIDNSGYSIAPMLLLPFVENAFKHGFNGGGGSWIDISLVYTQKGIEFEVRNSLESIEKYSHIGKEYSGIGIKNVQERLEILYPAKHCLKVNDGFKEFTVYLSLELK